MLRSIHIALVACLMVALAACGANTNTQAESSVQTQTIDGLTISLEAPPSPKLLQAANFLVTLTDSAGTPVEGADVYLELLMPAMPMGTNQPVASADGPGRYRAQGVFDMAGDWHVTVHAKVEGKDHAAQFISKVEELE